MQAYYLATAAFRNATLNMLRDEFHNTGQVIYWLVRHCLEANYDNFDSECQSLGSVPIPVEDLRPTKVFLPMTTMNPDEKYKVVEAAVSQLMDMMSEEEWKNLEDNYGKAKKPKTEPPKNKTTNTKVADIISASNKIVNRPLNKQVKY